MAEFRPGGILGQRFKRIGSLLGEVEKDETISDITRSELTTELTTLQGFSGTDFAGAGGTDFVNRIQSAADRLNLAREGGGIFSGRQQQKQRKTILADRPGRAQTILTR